MSASVNTFVNALDNYTGSQLGENGAKEYAWSNSFRERIIQLFFQITRLKVNDRNKVTSLSNIYYNLIDSISIRFKSGLIIREEYLEYMSLLYRLIGHTRDIIDGKGEYMLSYILLNTWAKHNLELAEFALTQFVINDKGLHPYGSWKDIKGLYKYDPNGPLISYSLNLVIDQLNKDIIAETPSLLAKWVPREKSSSSHLFSLLATNYYCDYIASAKTDLQHKRALLKAKTDFRKLISYLNKKLDTVQIKQCANDWASIDPSSQTSITMHKQKRAFLNLDKRGSERVSNEDRRLCAEHFKEYAEKAVKGEVTIKGKRLGLNDMVNDVLSRCLSDVEKDILNSQWTNNAYQNGNLGKMIAMVDVSGSMDGDPMNAAIGLGLRIAEKSMLGKRLLTFSATPAWVNLEGYDKFTDMVEIVRYANWGMNTNFTAALNMILDSIIINKLPAEDVEDMVLVILSDMQIDQADRNAHSLMESIELSYADAGIRVCGKPYKTPHILFWNLRSTSGFPTLSSQRNSSMMSGFSPALLNMFCEEGLNSLQSCSPWSLFKKALDSERYSILDNKLRETL
jgi:hypothetical protein